MTWQAFLSLVASSVGFVSGVWLCAGAVLISPQRIVKADDQTWDAEPDIAGALISQSAEYLAGGTLLALTFGLQIAAVLVPATNLPTLIQDFQEVLVVLGSVVVSALVSYPLYVSRRKYLQTRVHRIKQAKQS